MTEIDLILRLCALSVAVFGAAVLFARITTKRGRALLTFALYCAAGQLLGPWVMERVEFPGVFWLVAFLADDLAPVAFLVTAIAMLEIELKHPWLPLAALAAKLIWAPVVIFWIVPAEPTSSLYSGLAFVGALLSLSILFLALFLVLSDLKDDVVESRRRLRLLIFYGCSAFFVIVVVFELFLRGETPSPEISLAEAAASLVFVLVVGVYAIANLDELVPSSRRRQIGAAADPVLETQAKALVQAVQDRELFLIEGLTLSGLADNLGQRDHRLRQVINKGLGYRNFNKFINDFRISFACKVLANPDAANKTILEIAYASGFASLGPFNRAFREATGQTPTEYRRNALAAEAPQKAVNPADS